MNSTIETMKAKGKWHPKEEFQFLSKATLEQVEQAERNKKALEFHRLDSMDARGEIDPYNPPKIWAITFQRWLLRKHGPKWVADYLKKTEYAGKTERIPDRLRALGMSEADIEAAMNPLATLRRRNSKICSIANSIPRSVSRKDAFAMARGIVNEGNLELKIAGVSFGNRQTALKRLATYNPSDIAVTLTPEPENLVDKNAVAVMVSVNGGIRYRIGYVPAENTKTVRIIGSNARIKVIPGTTYGARLDIAV